MKNISFYNTILGKIGIASEDNKIIKVVFGESSENKYKIEENSIIRKAYNQLYEYLAGERKKFELDLDFNGTYFQNKVWNTLLRIPYGETWSYKHVAIEIGNQKACRAVGMANNRNPIPVFIPCHRVIGANGKLIGYSSGLHIKKMLLEIEKNSVFNR